MTRLATRSVEKPWGSDRLPAPFSAPDGKRIGEIWFEPPPELPSLLVKYIFTSEKLSVQVHPTDAQAAAAHEPWGGKEECWVVIDAAPGARLGVGFREPIDPQAMRAAALDGSIEGRLAWHPVRAGDFFYIPAGTVHAIGEGVSLIEVQQNSDVTYRLYDYGRPRELHLDKAVAVAKGEPHPPELRRAVPAEGTVELARGRYFTLHRLDGPPSREIAADYGGPLIAVPLDGAVQVAGEAISPGEAAWAASIEALRIDTGVRCLVARPSDQALSPRR